MGGSRPRRGSCTFALLVVVAEVAGRSLTAHVDRAFHVAPLAPTGASYYPFLLVAVKIVAALALAALLARGGPRLGCRRRRGAAARLPSATARAPRATLPAWAVAARLARRVRRYLARVSRARRRRGGAQPAVGRCSRRGSTPTRYRSSPSWRCSSRAPGGSPAGSTTSRTTPQHDRACPAHPHRAFRAAGLRSHAPPTTTRSASPLRPRVRDRVLLRSRA